MDASEKEQLRERLHRALGEALRELREGRPGKPSQEALADEIGMDRSYWGDLERGERTLTLYNLWRLARALRVSPSRLVLDIDRRYRRISAEQTPGAERLMGELRRVRDFMDKAATMKWFADRQRKCVYCNRALLQYMGCTLEQMQGDAWRTAIHPEDRERRDAISNRAFARAEPYNSQYRLRRADGVYAWVAQQAWPWFSRKRVFLGMMASVIVIPDPEALSHSDDKL